MERMKIKIEKSEYDRLKSREEKLMAYYEWFVDKENDLVTVEDVVNKNIELEEENKKLKEEVDELDRINHNLNAKLSDLYDVKQILRDIVININRLDKLKKIVFKYDTESED